METILLWKFNKSDCSFNWHVPALELEDTRLLEHFSLATSNPLLKKDNDDRTTRLSDAILSDAKSKYFSGQITDWSGNNLFSKARLTAVRDRNGATGVIICEHPADTSNISTSSKTAKIQTTPADQDIATLESAQQKNPDFTSVLIEAIEALPEAFVLYGADDRLVVCNEQYRRLYPTVADMMAPGLSFDDVMNESVRRGVFQLTEDAEIWTRRRLSFHHANIGFFEQHLADGRWIQVSERKTPSGAISSIRVDITVLKEREADLRAALEQSKNELSKRTHFVAKVGHELRNPLNVIYNIAQVLKEENSSPSQQRTLDTLFGAASVMRDVLRDFLDVTSLRSGQFSIAPRPTDTRPLIREILDFARLMGRQSKISFRSRTAHDIPRQILTDPQRIRQIMFNLLGNAFKYAPGGTVVLSSDIFKYENNTAVLRIAVTDSGKGIGNTLGGQIFTPYTRNREHRLAGIEGLGLGLAISEELAAALGITLGITPLDEGGTRAWIDLPIVSKDQLAQSPSRRTAPLTPAGSGPVLDILVIDDEPANLIVAESVLKRLGHNVTKARSGQQALLLLQDRSFDAALLDISMPEMSGVELAHAIISGDFASNDMGLIAMTGNVMPDDIRHYFDAGITGFVEKPVDIQSLAEALATSRKGPRGKLPLTPQERVRFPHNDKANHFDRGRLDRMLDDIGYDNVIAIISSSLVTMQSALSLIRNAHNNSEEVGRILHKVQSVAGLLGFDPLAKLAQLETLTYPPHNLQMGELQDALTAAISQLQSYKEELNTVSMPDYFSE